MLTVSQMMSIFTGSPFIDPFVIAMQIFLDSRGEFEALLKQPRHHVETMTTE